MPNTLNPISDQALVTQLLQLTQPSIDQTTIKNDVNKAFTNKNVHDLLQQSNRDHVFLKSPAAQQVWHIVRQLHEHANKQATSTIKHVNTVADIHDLLHERFSTLDHEEAIVLALSPNNDVIDTLTVNIGDASSTIIDNNRIVKWALQLNARGIILGHNHPSNSVNPTKADIVILLNLQQVLRTFDINLIDSLIITDTDQTSLAKEKLIE